MFHLVFPVNSAAKLADLGLKDGMELLAAKNVDEKGKARSRPLAFDEASKRDKMFDVIVEDRRVPATVYNRYGCSLCMLDQFGVIVCFPQACVQSGP